ncbi:hypothetical protein EKD04_006220 [Chloroflexales bacterium ZM16-3]|nr:hypothetical protein [Chloroflexales bacterium ZM16-3]
MRSTRTYLRWSRLALALLACTLLISATTTYAAGSGSPQQRTSTAGLLEHNGVLSLADGSVALAADAAPASPLLGAFRRSGSLIAEPPTSPLAAARFRISYGVDLPRGTALRVDVRASLDGTLWTPWMVDMPSGAVVGFPVPAQRVQYRLTLMGDLGLSPVVRSVSLEPTSAPATYEAAAADPYAVAPTFRIRATRQGMIGGRTANGFVIPPHARFVSLPCWCALSSKGGDEYKVRITYRGRSTVVPVYDVGPYSARDDYWNTQRKGYPDLERGWPMDHAAYYEGYNGKQADKGYVRFPTAMDVGDGAWIDDLGIVGDQAEVEVTMLWMGADPLAGPPARDPNLPEQVVDELGGSFWHSSPDIGVSAVGCGYERHAYQAKTVTDQAQSTQVARWQPNLPTAGDYDLYVHVPVCPSKRATTSAARYVIQHRDGALEVAVNQAAQPGWVHLGRFPFSAGSDGFIQLSDLAGDAGATVWFDQAKWVRAP